MRSTVWFLMLTFSWTFLYPAQAKDAVPTLKAKSAILVEAETGQILYSRHPDAKRPPASMTKVMTAILLLERAGLEDYVTASENAVNTGNSSMNLRVGEKIKVRDLLHAILLRSANDGSVAAAEHVAGSVQAFAKLMNKKARELGAMNTHFVNPHGLHHPVHLTTARDMAIIIRYAMLNPVFCEIVSKSKAVIERSKNNEDVWMMNRAKFLKLYPWAEGVKTGYTRQAGFCFAGSARRDGRRLLSVVMNSDDRDNDTIALMEYGYNQWKLLRFGKSGEVIGKARVVNGSVEQVPVVLTRDAVWSVQKNHADAWHWALDLNSVRAPIEEGSIVGRAVLRRGEEDVRSVPVAAAQSVAKAPLDKRIWGAILTIGASYAFARYLRYLNARKRSTTRLLRSFYH